ncbi:hypothetical protein GCM10009860_06890 [Microbacterium mitrae]|uniref:histidine kinase n=1 Tax=Microbacterium mitrae TaxID=664640 RepID=UPI001650B640|nr:histidine kinase [Microbacterium mitrae]
MKSRIASRIAAAVMALEALVVLGLAGLQIVELFKGNTMSFTSAVALIVLTIIIGAAMVAFAWGLLTEQTWARSGGIVTQLMALAIALGALTGQFAHPAVAAAIALPAIIGLIAIFQAAKQTAADERRARAEADTAPDDLPAAD